ncbi:hypothetical protein BC830DRAFT_1172292, partial [Chytriomyces sp. MP71]
MPRRDKDQSSSLPDTSQRGSGPIHRSTKSVAALTATPEDGIATVFDVVTRGFDKSPDLQMFGQRPLVRIVEESKEIKKKLPGGGETTETKVWKYFEMGPFEWKTWGQAKDITSAYASGLRSLGLKQGDKLTIFADTSRDWMFMAISCILQSITVTTAYATLGEEGLTYSLQECEVTTIFTNADLLPMVNKIAAAVKTLKNVIYNGTADNKILEKLQKEQSHLKIISIEELKALGEYSMHAEDLALIMYTSGSTGPPKGVMITHANVIAAISGANNYLQPYLSPKEQEVYLAYLPLAHILEFTVEMTLLYLNVQLGYGGVKTLTDTS